MTALAFTVRGRVQGVGFRWFALRAARARGVGGWVRNAPDGTVVGEVEGDAAAVAGFVDDLGRGPTAGRVDAVDTEPVAARGAQAFEIR